MFMGGGSALAQTDYDCFIGEESGDVNYYERQNSGAGSMSFSAVTGSSNPLYEDGNGWRVDVGMHSSLEFVDIDGDGDQDCFIGGHNGLIYYSKNTGTSSSPTFVEWDGNAESADPNPFYDVDVGTRSAPAFVDIDDDGDYDCFIGEVDGNINYYKNTGNSSSPTFTLTTGSGNDPFYGVWMQGTSSQPEFVDIDGDGDYDCFKGMESGRINYYENTGNSSSAAFTARTGDDNPLDDVSVGYNSNHTFVNIDGDASLPVELTSFNVLSTRNDAVILQWITESEINNLGFILDRRVPGTEWTEIATYITHPELQGQGSVTHQTIYSYTDNTVLSAETYDYRLADVDYDGNKVYHSMTVMGVSPNDVVPETFTLYPAYPNPFNPTTNIRYDLPVNALVNITIYDIMGRSIRSLVNSKQTAGYRSIRWDGKNNLGEGVSAGMYIYMIQAGDFRQTKKMVLLK